MKVSTGGNEGLRITLQVREPQGRNRWDSGTDSIVWKKEDLQIRKGQFLSPASHTPLFWRGVYVWEETEGEQDVYGYRGGDRQGCLD